jgi:putative ABC transport system permease protein
MLRNYFKIAWRNLIKHNASGIINILGLAIGVFSCMAIWMITHFELSYDKFHPDKERIYRLVSEFRQRSGEVAHWGDVPEPVAAQLRVELPRHRDRC